MAGAEAFAIAAASTILFSMREFGGDELRVDLAVVLATMRLA